MKFRLGIILFIVAFAITGCAAQSAEGAQVKGTSELKSEKKDIYDRSEFVLGTIVSIRLFEDGSEEALDIVFDRMAEIEERMSFNSNESEVIEVNEAAGISPVIVSEDTFEVISAAIEFADKSGGKFDPTIGPLVKLWGIGSEDASVPSDSDRKNAVQLANWKDVELNSSDFSIFLREENMELDLGAIAKGYASDEAVRLLKDNNISRAIINLGGNVYAFGEKADSSPWKIGIQNPFSTRGEYIGIVSLKNKSVVTSGVYERYFEQDGVKYHHILDSKTGFPVDNELASVTIISESSINADAMSTVLFAAGVEEGLKFIERYYPDVDAIFVTKDKNVYSTGLDAYNVEWTDGNFTVY